MMMMMAVVADWQRIYHNYGRYHRQTATRAHLTSSRGDLSLPVGCAQNRALWATVDGYREFVRGSPQRRRWLWRSDSRQTVSSLQEQVSPTGWWSCANRWNCAAVDCWAGSPDSTWELPVECKSSPPWPGLSEWKCAPTFECPVRSIYWQIFPLARVIVDFLCTEQWAVWTK